MTDPMVQPSPTVSVVRKKQHAHHSQRDVSADTV